MKILSLTILAFLTASTAVAEQRSLLAYLRVKEGSQEIFLEAAKDVIRESRQEAGNIIYNLHQSVNDPQQFVFYELFRSHEDLMFHRKAKHVISFLNKIKPILVKDGFTLTEFR